MKIPIYFRLVSIALAAAIGFLAIGCMIDDLPSSSDPIRVTGVELDEETLTIDVGDTVTLNATITPDNATNTTVTWTSDDSNIAMVDYTRGRVYGVREGTAIITVKTQDGDFTAECVVTVKPVPVADVTLPSTMIVVKDTTATLYPTFIPRNATNKKVTWTSDDETIATIDEKGEITGVELGTTTITVKTDDGGFEAECTVTVSNYFVMLTPNPLALTVGETAALTVTLDPEPSNKTLTWESNDENIATVAAGVVTAVGLGTTTITVTIETDDGETLKPECVVTVFTGASEAAAGGNHTVTIRSDGTLWAWGQNGDGQLGDGSTTDRPSPVKIGSAANWASVSTGNHHTVAIQSNNSLWIWGANYYGQLGKSNTTADPANRSPARIGTSLNWASASAGGLHTVAITTNGQLYAWGYNYYGQLGNNDSGNYTSGVEKDTAKYEAYRVRIGTATNWKTVSAGQYHTVAIQTDGTLWAWGCNEFGQVGNGTTTNRTSPVKIGTDTNWKSVSAGNDHTVAIKTDGTLWAWGRNDSGQLGNGESGDGKFKSAPIKIGTDTNWKSVSAGGYHTAAIQTDGTLWTWGRNDSRQLGDGTETNCASPMQIGTDTDWETVSAGGLHTVAKRANSTLWAWGSNYNDSSDDDLAYNSSPTMVIP